VNILLLDNYDSFTYNLFQLLASCGALVRVVRNDCVTVREMRGMRPDGIVLSPGPGGPERSGVCMAAIRCFYRRVPMLGVCLGNECIGAVFGSRIVHARRILHGKTSPVYHTGTGLFQGLPNPLIAARYHSLALDRVPRDFYLSAWAEDGEVMAVTHVHHPVFGIQFHPESFMTDAGAKLVGNFLDVCNRFEA